MVVNICPIKGYNKNEAYANNYQTKEPRIFYGNVSFSGGENLGGERLLILWTNTPNLLSITPKQKEKHISG